jgi:hypothetical protein
MSTYAEQMQHIWLAYERAGSPMPATTHDVARWAIANGLWKPQPADIIRRCASDLADALRQEYFTDDEGRRVRAKHAARVEQNGVQMVLWDDIRTAPRKHMELAFKQRRQQIVSDCHQLKMDADSYNENHRYERPIQMVFDFTNDLMELEHGSGVVAKPKTACY